MWKPIPGWPYEVSDAGKVRRVGGKTLTPMLTGPKRSQYDTVVLCDGPRKMAAKVHRLVALVFIGPPPPDKPYVLHRDGDRRNNRRKNLRYGDQSENMQDMRSHHQHRFKASDVTRAEIRRRRAAGESGAALAREFNLSTQYVCDIHKGRK